jgi:hypothetical protein
MHWRQSSASETEAGREDQGQICQKSPHDWRPLESFTAGEIPPDRDIGASLRHPLLLLLAEHRSFQI